MQDFGLYVIATRPALGHKQVAQICVRRGVRMLQLREKHLPDRELQAIARQMREVTAGTATRFIVNDRVDIALSCGADGVHLGQDDLPYREARRIAGPDMMIGLSTHSLAQARDALALRPDYIGFGPVWPTPAKQIADQAVGTDMLREALALSDVPVVAIGGIFPENIDLILEAGAHNLSLVRYLMDTPDTEARIASIQEIFAR